MKIVFERAKYLPDRPSVFWFRHAGALMLCAFGRAVTLIRNEK